ncbi:unnamed protein product [Amaranthus hypochondriacus]
MKLTTKYKITILSLLLLLQIQHIEAYRSWLGRGRPRSPRYPIPLAPIRHGAKVWFRLPPPPPPPPRLGGVVVSNPSSSPPSSPRSLIPASQPLPAPPPPTPI